MVDNWGGGGDIQHHHPVLLGPLVLAGDLGDEQLVARFPRTIPGWVIIAWRLHLSVEVGRNILWQLYKEKNICEIELIISNC